MGGGRVVAIDLLYCFPLFLEPIKSYVRIITAIYESDIPLDGTFLIIVSQLTVSGRNSAKVLLLAREPSPLCMIRSC